MLIYSETISYLVTIISDILQFNSQHEREIYSTSFCEVKKSHSFIVHMKTIEAIVFAFYGKGKKLEGLKAFQSQKTSQQKSWLKTRISTMRSLTFMSGFSVHTHYITKPKFPVSSSASSFIINYYQISTLTVPFNRRKKTFKHFPFLRKCSAVDLHCELLSGSRYKT